MVGKNTNIFIFPKWWFFTVITMVESAKKHQHKKKIQVKGVFFFGGENFTQHFLVGGWTTHLKNMLVKLGSSSPIFGMKIKNVWNHHPVLLRAFQRPQGRFFQPKEGPPNLENWAKPGRTDTWWSGLTPIYWRHDSRPCKEGVPQPDP